jgi:hypothetical protein
LTNHDGGCSVAGVARPRKLIGEFLLELNTDRRKFTRYAEDRDTVLASSGLTEKQQNILKSDDLRKIRDAIRDEYQSAEVIVVPCFMFVLAKPPKSE